MKSSLVERRLAPLALCAALCAAPFPQAAAQDAPDGRQIYEQGLPVQLRPALGTVQNDVAFNAGQLVCANCHRRSGLGSSEGGIVIPPVTGDVLFKPRVIERRELWGARTEGEGTRPAYTADTLARAIREGVDAAGRPLDALMPRYALDDAEMRSLIAYLKLMSSRDALGVTATEIHFATITSDRIAVASETALLNLMGAWFKAKNGQTRREARRAANPPWHKNKIFPAYRTWVLHHWRLTGPPETWQDQLDAHYGAQPVFAILSGNVGAPWAPIHAFTEARGIPTLLPHTEHPETSGHFTFYAHEGMALRAKAIASDLQRRAVRRVVQIYKTASAGASGAATFRREWRADGNVADIVLPEQAADLSRLLAKQKPEAVIWWLDDGTERLATGATGAMPQFLYLAGSTPDLPGTVPLPARRVFAVHPYRLPETLDTGMRPLREWLKARNIAPGDPPLMADAFLAMSATGEALMHMNTFFSREYFIEKLEHGLGRNTFSGYYPQLSSAPGQRFIAKGSYIVELDRDAKPTRYRWFFP